jgi:hypothetical protein
MPTSDAKPPMLVKTWCPEARDVVLVGIRGEAFGRMLEGEVVRCARQGGCPSEGKGFCWLRKEIRIRI